MIKKTLLLLFLFLVFVSSVLAADLVLVCSPTSVAVEGKVYCDLRFSASQSFLSVDGTLTLPSGFDSAVEITNMATDDFTGSYNPSTKKIIISDDKAVKGAVVTKVATLTFTAKAAGSGVATLSVKEILDKDLNDISLTTKTVSSGTLTISSGCIPSCPLPSAVCQGTTNTQADGCGGSCAVVGTKTTGECAGTPTCDLKYDYTNDGYVGQNDFNFLSYLLGQKLSCPAGKVCDVNGNGEVKTSDLQAFMSTNKACLDAAAADSSLETLCGNNKLDSGEVCDLIELGTQQCPAGTTGSPSCNANCLSVDTSSCVKSGAACVDHDKGDTAYTTPSYVTSTAGDQYDGCYPPVNGVLKEFYCDGDTAKDQDIECDAVVPGSVCSSGACVVPDACTSEDWQVSWENSCVVEEGSCVKYSTVQKKAGVVCAGETGKLNIAKDNCKPEECGLPPVGGDEALGVLKEQIGNTIKEEAAAQGKSTAEKPTANLSLLSRIAKLIRDFFTS